MSSFKLVLLNGIDCKMIDNLLIKLSPFSFLLEDKIYPANFNTGHV